MLNCEEKLLGMKNKQEITNGDNTPGNDRWKIKGYRQEKFSFNQMDRLHSVRMLCAYLLLLSDSVYDAVPKYSWENTCIILLSAAAW